MDREDCEKTCENCFYCRWSPMYEELFCGNHRSNWFNSVVGYSDTCPKWTEN